MKTVIIYNKETGDILLTQDNINDLTDGVFTNIIAEVPENKIIKSVNPKTKELILEDMPKSETELLQEKIERLENDMADLMLEIAMEGDK